MTEPEDLPEIYIVQAAMPKPGDLLVLCTNESLSADAIYNIRGRLSEWFDDKGIEFVIVCGASLTHITKGEMIHEYHKQADSQ